jgi:hypothetical protein
LLRQYADTVIIEVGGHDHYADLRYHNTNGLKDLPDLKTSTDFHNLLVAPGITPNKGQNPGVAMFQIDDNLVPTNLRMEFLNLQPTLGVKNISYEMLKFFSVDFNKDFGLNNLDPISLATFRKALEAGGDTPTLNYLVSKLGFDPNDSTQLTAGINILIS